MADEQPDADPDVGTLEAELRRLPDVAAVRVVADEIGRPTEVHVLGNTGKHAKQIVRDVQSVALASFGLEIDRRIVSVVQLTPNGETPATTSARLAPARVRVLGVQASSIELRTSIRVTLELGEQTTGYAEGAAATTIRPRLVATATLDALRQLVPAADCFDVVGAELIRVGNLEVALVTVVAVDLPLEQHLAGSAIVRHGVDDAIVRAALDAVNRRLALPSPEPADE
jgi:hypothetical protein